MGWADPAIALRRLPGARGHSQYDTSTEVRGGNTRVPRRGAFSCWLAAMGFAFFVHAFVLFCQTQLLITRFMLPLVSLVGRRSARQHNGGA